MDVGIFAKTYHRSTLEAVLDAVAADGFHQIQFNFESTGRESMPAQLDPTLLGGIAAACAEREIAIAALSGTFNLIHPDPQIRGAGLSRLAVLAAAARPLGTRLITLCTGTRDPDDMWRHHPDNGSAAAWKDLQTSLTRAIDLGEQYDLSLGIEPEPGNVVANAARARTLLDDMQSDRLGVIFDPANLIEGVPVESVNAVLTNALDLLGSDVISVHGKDRAADGAFVPAGTGVVPWDMVLTRLNQSGYSGSILLHGLDESEAHAAKAYLEQVISSISS